MADRTIDVFWHDDTMLHDTGSGVFEHPPSPLIEVSELHPENDVRIRNIRSCLQRGPVGERLRWRDGRHATVAELEMLHEPGYVEHVLIRHGRTVSLCRGRARARWRLRHS